MDIISIYDEYTAKAIKADEKRVLALKKVEAEYEEAIKKAKEVCADKMEAYRKKQASK